MAEPGARRIIIEKLGARGEGVADGPRGPIYVPHALPGETVTVQGEGERAALVSVESASPDRISPICGLYTQCGGCAVQALAPEPYAAWKRGIVVTAFEQARIPAPIAPLVTAHGEGRRRVTFHMRGEGRQVKAGFMRARSHDVLNIETCPILAPELSRASDIAREIGRILGPLGKPLDCVASASENGLDIDIRGAGPLGPSERATLLRLAEREDLARISNHGEILIERRPPSLVMGRARVVPPPGAFLQATQAGEEALSRLVSDACKGAKRVADLFAGVGTFAFRIAERSEVHAVEGDAQAVLALDKAARLAQLRVTSEARDLFHRPLMPDELRRFDAVVFDPPRAGAEAQAQQIAASEVPLVVAVSCNPGTLARDAAILLKGGYACEQVTPVDQFLYSAHVESVAIFRKAKPAARRRGLLSR